MLPDGLNLMSAVDFAEYSVIKRRLEFLEFRASYLWKYRQVAIERAYADVKDGLTLKSTATHKEDE